MNKFEIGECIYHKSNSGVKWVVERIDNDDIYCSTIIKDTLEQKKEVFFASSIEKCAKPGPRSSVISSNTRRDTHW